jgi:uncharacterized protein
MVSIMKSWTRRRVLKASTLAAAAGALAQPLRVLGSETIPLLKRRVGGVTWNAHVHLTDPNWWSDREPRSSRLTREDAERLAQRWVDGRDIEVSADEREEYIRRAITRYSPSNLAEVADTYVEYMDSAGLDKTIALFVDQSFVPGAGGRQFQVPYEQVLEEARELVLDRYPDRFIAYAGVNPLRGKSGIALLERAVTEFGFSGMGEWVSQQWGVMATDRPTCYPYFEKCVELGIPFVPNVESANSECDPGLFDQVAADFPELRINLAGAGHPRASERQRGTARLDWPDKALQVAADHEHVYLEPGDWQTSDPERVLEVRQHFHRALRGPARKKFMYGSDHPVYAVMYTEAEWIEVLIDGPGPEFSDDDLERLFSSNAASFVASNRKQA